MQSKRLYHIVTTLITIIAAISYFGMATGHGVTYHTIEITEKNEHVPDTTTIIKRQVFWARYVDWSLTTPLLLLDLALLAGLNGAHILIAIVADLIMIVTGLFAAFGGEETPQKWGWYAIACIAYLVVVWQLAINGRTAVSAKSSKVAKFFGAIAGFTLILWTAYPMYVFLPVLKALTLLTTTSVWGVADGARIASVDSEIIAYAVLDVLAKPVFGAWLLFTHQSMPETNVEIGGFWAHGLSGEGSIRIGDDDEGA
jgi:bacteriorhodopsin